MRVVTMQSGILLNSLEHMNWLRTKVPRGGAFRWPVARSAVLYGNEDAPDLVVLFKEKNPGYDAQPVAFLVPDDEE